MTDVTTRVQPATAELCPTIADDLLRGADEIARFVFGSPKHRRKIYYYATDAKVRMQQVVLPGTGMVPIGIATIAAGNGVTTVRVRLDGVATAAA
jgi:hypothetical protein